MTSPRLEPDAPQPPVFLGDGSAEFGLQLAGGGAVGRWATPSTQQILRAMRETIHNVTIPTHRMFIIDSIGYCYDDVHLTSRFVGSMAGKYLGGFEVPLVEKPGDCQQWIPVSGSSKCLPTRDAEFHAKRARARKKLRAQKKSRKQNR